MPEKEGERERERVGRMKMYFWRCVGEGCWRDCRHHSSSVLSKAFVKPRHPATCQCLQVTFSAPFCRPPHHVDVIKFVGSLRSQRMQTEM